MAVIATRPSPGREKTCFGDDRAGQQPGELDAEIGHGRDERVLERVADDDRRVRSTPLARAVGT